MVPFAGYALPVQYPAGIMAEHQHTREAATLFDVSHMGQLRLDGADRAATLEALVPVDVAGLAVGRQRYGFFTNDGGGILDDLMISNQGDWLFLVVNAGCKEADIAYLKQNLEGDVRLRSEEHTSELPVTNAHIVCRLLLEKKKNKHQLTPH